MIQRDEWNNSAEVKAGRNEWGAIPDCTEFQHPAGRYEKPARVRGWGYSVTFGRWGAYVTFADGWAGFTFPKTQGA